MVPGRHRRRRRWRRWPMNEGRRGPQGLRHPQRQLERDRRPGLRGLRAGAAAAMLRAGPAFRSRGGGLGQLGHAGGLVAGFLGNNIRIPLTGIGVSRPRSAGAAGAQSAGRGRSAGRLASRCPRGRALRGGFWQPGPLAAQRGHGGGGCNSRRAARAWLLDPVYTGKVMAGPIVWTAARSAPTSACCSCTPAACGAVRPRARRAGRCGMTRRPSARRRRSAGRAVVDGEWIRLRHHRLRLREHEHPRPPRRPGAVLAQHRACWSTPARRRHRACTKTCPRAKTSTPPCRCW